MSNYNGWTNYATWNTALWVDNEEYTYFTRIDEQKRIVEWTAALVESCFLMERLTCKMVL